MARISDVSGGDRFALRGFGLALLLAALPVLCLPGWSATAQAATEERESPRVAMTVGPVGIVLIAANQQLYAFLDRLSDNAPVVGGKIKVKAPKADLTLSETAPGVYRAGPFLPAVGHTPLSVSVESLLGAGQTAAVLVVEPVVVPPTLEGRLRPLWYAIGVAAVVGLGWLGWRSRRRLYPLAGAGTGTGTGTV